MIHRTPIVAIVILLHVAALPGLLHAGASGDDIRKKQSRLDKLRKEINQFEGKIREREKKEHATLDQLDNYDRQTTLLRKLIHRLQDEEQSLQADIGQTRESIALLSGQVSALKSQYARSVTAAYVRGRTDDFELLLSSHSLNEMFVRSEYLRHFADQRRKDLSKMTDHRVDLEHQQDVLQKQLAEQHDLLREKAAEEQRLALKTKKRKLLLADIRKDKKSYRQEINRKAGAAKELEMLIAKLIEQDRIKKDLEAKKRGTQPPPRESGSPLEARRGSLRWPVSQGKIVAHFGAQQNPVLHTITQNNGVDIGVPAGTAVVAVGAGEVSTIWWLPSFGNVVILNHQGGYRTVYAHLSEILVNEGTKLADGAQIGRSGEALSGPMLHFEIWKDRDKLDPEQWLVPSGLTQR